MVHQLCMHNNTQFQAVKSTLIVQTFIATVWFSPHRSYPCSILYSQDICNWPLSRSSSVAMATTRFSKGRCLPAKIPFKNKSYRHTINIFLQFSFGHMCVGGSEFSVLCLTEQEYIPGHQNLSLCKARGQKLLFCQFGMVVENIT